MGSKGSKAEDSTEPPQPSTPASTPPESELPSTPPPEKTANQQCKDELPQIFQAIFEESLKFGDNVSQQRRQRQRRRRAHGNKYQRSHPYGYQTPYQYNNQSQRNYVPPVPTFSHYVGPRQNRKRGSHYGYAPAMMMPIPGSMAHPGLMSFPGMMSYSPGQGYYMYP